MSLQSIHAEFSRRIGRDVVIGGGAVRDEMMGQPPKDYDVFILNTSEEEGEVFKAYFSDLEYVKQLDFHKSEPFLIATVRFEGSIVQVMVTPKKSIKSLMDTFDWNVSLFAYDGEYHCRTAPADIATGKELRLQKVTFPASTLRRGYRFSERFGMILKKEDVVALCRAVVQAETKLLPEATAEPVNA